MWWGFDPRFPDKLAKLSDNELKIDPGRVLGLIHRFYKELITIDFVLTHSTGVVDARLGASRLTYRW